MDTYHITQIVLNVLIVLIPAYYVVRKKSSKRTRKIAGAILVLVILALVGEVFNHYNPSSQTNSSLTTSTSTRPYESTQYGFSIDFPGIPTATDSTSKVQGISVPTTSYELDNNNGNTDFYVTVVAYPSQFNMSDTKTTLEGALNGEIENIKGATLVSSSYGTLEGYTSITGHATVSNNGQTFNLYITILLKSNTLYAIVTVGATQSDFNNFANSFQLTN